MRKINPKAPENKPLRQMNKSISSIHASSLSIGNPEKKTIETQSVMKPAFDKQLIISIVKEEVSSLEFQIRQTREQLQKMTEQFQNQKQNNAIVRNQLKIEIEQVLKSSLKQEKVERSKEQCLPVVPIQTAVIQNKNTNNVEANIALIFDRLDILSEQNAVFRNLYSYNQIQSINQNIEDVQIELHTVQRQIQKDIAELRDSLAQTAQTVGHHINTVGNQIRLFDIEKTISQLTDKVNIIGISSEKQNIQIERIQRQVDLHETLIQKYQYKQSKLKDTLEASLNEAKQAIELQSRDLEEFLCQRLGKMIESYNNNFEQMDKSILDLKETIRQILYLNKFISDNIGQKLKNTIDNNTFNTTIANLNEKFSETYQMNYEKIVQLNTKQYQVQSELSYMKTMLENLKMDFKHNYSTQKLDEDLSLESSQNQSLEQSNKRSVDDKKKFMKPTFVFPERDSFNFNQERKRKSMGMEEMRRLTIKIDKDN